MHHFLEAKRKSETYIRAIKSSHALPRTDFQYSFSECDSIRLSLSAINMSSAKVNVVISFLLVFQNSVSTFRGGLHAIRTHPPA